MNKKIAKLYGLEVAQAQLDFCRRSITLERDDQVSAAPLEKGRQVRAMSARFARHLRNAMNDGRDGKSLFMSTRMATVQRTALATLASVGDERAATKPTYVRLLDAHTG